MGHLLAWEMHERDGSWHAWVSWIQQSGGRHVHKVVDVRAGSLRPLEHPDAYSSVPRRVRSSDGLIRPWSGETGLSRVHLSGYAAPTALYTARPSMIAAVIRRTHAIGTSFRLVAPTLTASAATAHSPRVAPANTTSGS